MVALFAVVEVAITASGMTKAVGDGMFAAIFCKAITIDPAWLAGEDAVGPGTRSASVVEACCVAAFAAVAACADMFTSG